MSLDKSNALERVADSLDEKLRSPEWRSNAYLAMQIDLLRWQAHSERSAHEARMNAVKVYPENVGLC